MADEGWQDAIEATASGVRLLLEVHPGSARSGVEGVNAWRGRIVVAVRAPPRGGKANGEVVALVARALSVAPADVRVASGAKTGRKAVEVAGMDVATASRLLRLACKG